MSWKSATCRLCPTKIAPNVTGLCVRCLTSREVAVAAPEPSPQVQLASDRERIRLRGELANTGTKYKEALQRIEQLEAEQQALQSLAADVKGLTITPSTGSGTSEATVVIVASDWHDEEKVDPKTVSGLNAFNLEIADQRTTKFFQAGLRLTRLLQQDVKIDHVVLALLGDFISGDIHEEVAEVCQVPPMEAISRVQNKLIGGIEFFLNHSKVTLTLPCHSGNHARTTHKTRFATENGHSLEYLMYLHLAAYFRNEPRVRFQIAGGYHSYMEIYDQTLRFHHGHGVKYGGGVGGIYIPVNKAIAQWDKGRRADLDVFGHFHQHIPAPKFVCNGSLIGFNAFALSIKADYERPQQSLFLIDKKRGRTCTWPILLS